MGRNLDGRIETVVPVIDPRLQARLAEVVEVLLADDVLASELSADGSWHKVPTVRGLDAQEELHRLAVERVAQ
jgi:polyphosphate kinase